MAPHRLSTLDCSNRPILGSFALVLLAAVVPVAFVSILDIGMPAQMRDNLNGIERAFFRIVFLLSSGALGIALGITSLLGRERPRWISILALCVGAPLFGRDFFGRRHHHSEHMKGRNDHVFLPFCLWIAAAFGIVAIALIASYAASHSSGHTGWEPFTSLILFVPLVVGGAVCFSMRNRCKGIARAGLCSLVVGLAGIALIITLDRTNRLVQYDRWIHRGMP